MGGKQSLQTSTPMRILLLLCSSILLAACGYDSPDISATTPSATAKLTAAVVTDSQVELSDVVPATNALSTKVAFKANTPRDINLCEGQVTHTERVNVKPVAKPPYLKAYKDPAFGTAITRITQSNFGEVRKPAYSTVQAWNADESLMFLYQQTAKGGTHILLDGQTYEFVRKLNVIPSDIEELHWSHTNPDEFFYVSKYSRDYGQFKRFSVSKNKSFLIKDFSTLCGARGLPTGGGDVHMQSWDDDLFGFRCRKDDDSYMMMSYRISTDEVIAKPIGEGTKWEPWTAPMPGPSGDRFWFQGATLGLDLETVERKMDMYKHHEHSNVGRTHDGQDALYQTVFNASPNGCGGDVWKGIGHLVEHNLETGECRPIINEDKGYPYTTSGTHVSAQAYNQPGWIAMSSVGYGQFKWFSNGRKAPALFSEVYLASTNPDNEVVCRLAQHRSFGKSAEQGDYPGYFGEPHATISPSGTRILFGSDWYDSGAVDTYVIELPSFVRQ